MEPRACQVATGEIADENPWDSGGDMKRGDLVERVLIGLVFLLLVTQAGLVGVWLWSVR